MNTYVLKLDQIAVQIRDLALMQVKEPARCDLALTPRMAHRPEALWSCGKSEHVMGARFVCS